MEQREETGEREPSRLAWALGWASAGAGAGLLLWLGLECWFGGLLPWPLLAAACVGGGALLGALLGGRFIEKLQDVAHWFKPWWWGE